MIISKTEKMKNILGGKHKVKNKNEYENEL